MTNPEADAQGLAGLAARCEAATGPDRKLDLFIAKAICFFDGSRASYSLNQNLFPKYTASLDAAMTLVPEGWDWGIAHFGPRGSEAQMWPRGDRTSDRKVIGSSDTSPALALCVAALRVRAPHPQLSREDGE